MESTSRADGETPVASINIVPLVDIMLVLLVIFMVTAPMLQQGVEVNLPKAATGPLRGSDEQLVVSIDARGMVFLGAGNLVPTPEIGTRVAAILAQRPESERKVYLKADDALGYGMVMQVMANLHQAGITNVGLVTAAPRPSPAPNRGGTGRP